MDGMGRRRLRRVGRSVVVVDGVDGVDLSTDGRLARAASRRLLNLAHSACLSSRLRECGACIQSKQSLASPFPPSPWPAAGLCAGLAK